MSLERERFCVSKPLRSAGTDTESLLLRFFFHKYVFVVFTAVWAGLIALNILYLDNWLDFTKGYIFPGDVFAVIFGVLFVIVVGWDMLVKLDVPGQISRLVKKIRK